MIIRKLFVVPLANNDHGKTTIVRALVNQGQSETLKKIEKGVKMLTTPWGRIINAFVFPRSFQEDEKLKYFTVEETLDKNDKNWRDRDLIIMPSHVSNIDNNNGDDLDQMINLAHSAGFDIICVPIFLIKDKGAPYYKYENILKKNWDERWTILNKETKESNGHLEALGRDLWTWISKALTRQ